MKKNAIITFDYEVFLGRNTGTIYNCVIKPTKLILDILKGNNAKAIFFVDATWLLFLKKNYLNDFLYIIEQLKEICKSGSSVELHLHPQWIQAKKTDKGIIFESFKHYKLHSLGNQEMLDLFKKSVELLENISNQKVHCFRAGGWCIEPFHRIKDAFVTTGIKYDFSVAPGISLKDDKIYDYDFSAAPKLPFYNFQYDVSKPEPNGSFVEIPLSTYKNNPVYRVINKIFLIFQKDKIFGDGKGNKEKSIIMTLYKGFRISLDMLTLDKTTHLFFKYLLKTHFRKSLLRVIVSHPKTISKQSLRNLVYVTSNYNTLNSSELDKFLINM
jgi:hypothetical protein